MSILKFARRVLSVCDARPWSPPIRAAQVSCHDAPIFRLLLKIAVSLRSSNVTLTIFGWLWPLTFLQVTCAGPAVSKHGCLNLRPSLFLRVRVLDLRVDAWSTYLAGAGPRSSRWLSIG